VFENLLAAYNPETGTVARNATGSFYTPRVVVDWMVDQALLAYFEQKLVRNRKPGGSQEMRERLDRLLSWEDIGWVDLACPGLKGA
jgi:adenine-specific DNA-methyltransferase